MLANRFRTVAWAAGVAAAALGCYLVSLQVASERAQLIKLEKRILSAKTDIRQLQTEIETRARLVQLERWNRDVLGLQAPQVSQYAGGELQLASYVAPRAAPQVMQVAATATVRAPVVTPVAALRPPLPRPVLAAVAAPVPAHPLLRHATYQHPEAAPAPALRKAALVMPAAAPTPRAPLLGDVLLGDIGRRAAAEAGPGEH